MAVYRFSIQQRKKRQPWSCWKRNPLPRRGSSLLNCRSRTVTKMYCCVDPCGVVVEPSLGARGLQEQHARGQPVALDDEASLEIGRIVEHRVVVDQVGAARKIHASVIAHSRLVSAGHRGFEAIPNGPVRASGSGGVGSIAKDIARWKSIIRRSHSRFHLLVGPRDRARRTHRRSGAAGRRNLLRRDDPLDR